MIVIKISPPRSELLKFSSVSLCFHIEDFEENWTFHIRSQLPALKFCNQVKVKCVCLLVYCLIITVFSRPTTVYMYIYIWNTNNHHWKIFLEKEARKQIRIYTLETEIGNPKLNLERRTTTRCLSGICTEGMLSNTTLLNIYSVQSLHYETVHVNTSNYTVLGRSNLCKKIDGAYFYLSKRLCFLCAWIVMGITDHILWKCMPIPVALRSKAGSEAARLLRSRAWIPLGACVCCLSIGPFDEVISFIVVLPVCVLVCDLETSTLRRLGWSWAIAPQ
jgi:hypothetical protein